MVIIDYLQYSDLESDVEDVLDLSHFNQPNKLGQIKKIIPSRLRRTLSPKKIVSNMERPSLRQTSSLPTLNLRRKMSNHFVKSIRDKRKRTQLVSRILKKCARSWLQNYCFELDRYIKLTSDQNDAEFWNERLRMDLQRASGVTVTGIVEESFVFSQHEKMETRVALVEVFLKFLKASIKEVIGDSFSYLSEEGYKVLAQKAVLQGVVALCQDFINEPYFRFLKMKCEEYGLTPLSNKECPSKSIIGSDGHMWKTDVNVTITYKEMIMEVKRTFSTVWVTDIEIFPADYIFGFKRQYAVDLLGGPPKIYPPVWMGHGYGKTREICCKPKQAETREIVRK